MPGQKTSRDVFAAEPLSPRIHVFALRELAVDLSSAIPSHTHEGRRLWGPGMCHVDLVEVPELMFVEAEVHAAALIGDSRHGQEVAVTPRLGCFTRQGPLRIAGDLLLH